MASYSHPSVSIRFFKIILKSNLEAIRIPNKFTGLYGSGLSNTVFLKPPDGKEWKVHLTKHDNEEVWFQDGWKEFACFYSLDEGNLILFKYGGTSQLDVCLFGKNGLEMDYPSSSKNNLRDDTIEILDEMPPNQKARHKTPLSSSLRPHEKMRNLRNLHVDSKTNYGQCQGTGFQKSTNAELKFPKEPEEDNMGARIFTKSTCLNSEHRRKRALTTVEKIRAINSASSFKSKNPFFMAMPMKFAKRHLEKEYGVVKLESLDGRTWPARYEIPRIKDGWKKFVMENGLKVGQVCVFEMIGHVFKVHIFGDEEKVKSRKRTCNRAKDLKVKEEKISSMQQQALLENLSSFESENPHFIVKLTHAYIHGRSNFHVPSQFARTHLHDHTESIKLVVQDVAWPVEYVFRIIPSGNELHELSCVGWRRFRKDNDLKVGDVCVFELVPNNKLTLQVTILRAHSTNSGVDIDSLRLQARSNMSPLFTSTSTVGGKESQCRSSFYL